MSDRAVPLQAYDDSWDATDPDANFKQDVALYSRIDPTPTLEGMSKNLGIPLGVIARYVLSKWAASGSSALMEAGPNVVQQMADVVATAESAGTDEARLRAYDTLSRMVSWLKVPLDQSNEAS